MITTHRIKTHTRDGSGLKNMLCFARVTNRQQIIHV